MTFAWPTMLEPETVAWQIQKAAVGFRSQFAGSLESIEFPGQYWKVAITIPPRQMVDAGLASAFFARLTGGSETVYVPYFPRRVPLGTMRGTPTLASAANRGDQQVTINTSGTVVAGDVFSVSGQLFIAFQDASPSAGVLVVPLVNRVRATYPTSTVVVWDRPTVKCNMPSNSFGSSYLTNIMAGLPVDLEEVP